MTPEPERLVRILASEAIRMHCIECLGSEGNVAEIERCACVHCGLYTFRPPYRKNRGVMTENQLNDTRGYGCLRSGQKSKIRARPVDSGKRGNLNWVKSKTPSEKDAEGCK